MKLKLINKKIEISDVKSFIFSAQGGSASGGEPTDSFTWTPGQFMVYRLDHENPDIRGKQRFFTISSAPFEKNIMLTTHIYKDPPASQARALRAGNSSTFKIALDNLKIGDLIEAKGPDGDFILSNTNERYVFIAGGIGITPFHSIITGLNHNNLPINVTLLYANKTEEFPFKKEFEQIAAENPTFKIHYVVSPNHIDENLIKEKVDDFQNKIFYVSGPEKMVEDFTEMLKGMGIRQDCIKQDFFPGYEAF